MGFKISDDESPPPLWPFLLICVGIAVWIDFGTLHRGQHSDSLINILASLYAWTPFFWEQDRYGSLLPLVATPIKHPLYNLLFQNAVTVWGGLAAPFLLARYLFRDAFYPLIAAAANVAFLLLATPLYRFEFLVDTGYGLPFALAFAALVLTIPNAAGRIPAWRWLPAMILIVLAHWVFLGTFLTLAPLVVLRWLLTDSARKWFQDLWDRIPILSRFGQDWNPVPRLEPTSQRLSIAEVCFGLVLVMVGLVGGLAAQRFADPEVAPTPFYSLPIWRWPIGWGGLVWDAVVVQAPHGCAWLVVCLLGVVFPYLFSKQRRHTDLVVPQVLSLFGASLAAILFMGTRRWVEINSYSYRYTMPSALLGQVAAFALALSPLRKLSMKRSSYALAAAAMWLAATVSYGFPSLRGVHDDLAASIGQHSTAVLNARCTHVAGDYWFVWKTVYHVNLLKYECGETEILWGVAWRGRHAWPRWRDMPPEQMRMGALPENREYAEWQLAVFGLLPVEVAEEHLDLIVFRRGLEN